MGTRKVFSQIEIAYASKAFNDGSVSLNALAREFNCDRKTIQRAILDNVFGRVSTGSLNLRLGNGPRPSDDILAARDYRLSIPHRDLTGELMGDPRVGMSALDRKSLACAKAVSAVSDNTYVASGVCQPSEAIGLSQTSVGKLPRIAIPSTSNGVGG